MQPASRVGAGDQAEEVEELGMPLAGMAGIGHLGPVAASSGSAENLNVSV